HRISYKPKGDFHYFQNNLFNALKLHPPPFHSKITPLPMAAENRPILHFTALTMIKNRFVLVNN
ncbi:MAG TPA: hypothetical protein PK637_08765, partial [Flavobacteriales bacterium]|nr:hypothetical protein [Flavobacteriales bacterium]